MEMYPSNTQCCFNVKLPQKISLEKEHWEVALVEMIIPSQYKNITAKESYFDLVTSDKLFYQEVMDIKPKNLFNVTKIGDNPSRWRIRIIFPPGCYSNGSHLVDVMNDVLQSLFSSIWQKKGQKLEIRYVEHMNRPKILFHHIKNTAITFAPTLYQKMGGHASEDIFVVPNSLNDFPYNTNLDIGFNQVFIYSDIVEYSIVGHIQAPLLRVVPFKSFNNVKSSNQHIHHEFLNLHYLPIAKSEFDTIGINIRGDLGDTIQFVSGKSMVKLHFRKRTQP